MILAKTLWVINKCVWVIVVEIHDAWVHCWWWEVVVKIPMNVFWFFKFFFSNYVLINIFKMFFILSIFSAVLFMLINKVIFIIGIVHSIDVILWFLKVDWVQFRFMTSDCIFGRWWDWFIHIIIEVFGYWPMSMIIWRRCSIYDFFFMNNYTMKGHVSNFPSCWINSSFTPLLLSSHTRQSSFRYEIE